jgi:two-component system sensor histidine kinase PilS (NtrC family)
MGPAENNRQLRWLMSLRVVIISTLLVCAFAIELLVRPAETLRPLFLVAAVAFGTVLLYAVLSRWLGGSRSFIGLQLIGDALIITHFVGITGGVDSPMSFLYLLPISAASTMLYRRGGLMLAGVCWALYGTLVVLGPAWPPLGVFNIAHNHRDPGRLVYFLVAHLVAMVGFALLSSYLSERLRIQGKQLDERTGTVARLRALNENIIGSINSGLVTTNLCGEISFVNPGGEEITGSEAGQIVGRGVESFFRLGDGFLEQIRLRLLAHRRFRFERYFVTPDGRRIFLGIAASNLHDRVGRPLGYIFIFQDLTEIHALELEVRLKERMAALGEMAAGMAHELRNPLAAISGSVQFLKTDLEPEGEVLELMDIILRESQRLDQAIRDFLTFARPGRFSPQRVDLVKLLEDSVKLLRKSSECGPDHRLITRHAAERIECHVDPNRIRQVFWNLATNALKAMPDGGALTLGVELTDDERTVAIVFDDQGKGMTREERERYFQPFSSSFDEGTGLGAAIVYRLVQEHGGTIRLDSEQGRGTRVVLTLPRCGAAEGEPLPECRLQAVGGLSR